MIRKEQTLSFDHISFTSISANLIIINFTDKDLCHRIEIFFLGSILGSGFEGLRIWDFGFGIWDFGFWIIRF